MGGRVGARGRDGGQPFPAVRAARPRTGAPHTTRRAHNTAANSAQPPTTNHTPHTAHTHTHTTPHTLSTASHCAAAPGADASKTCSTTAASRISSKVAANAATSCGGSFWMNPTVSENSASRLERRRTCRCVGWVGCVLRGAVVGGGWLLSGWCVSGWVLVGWIGWVAVVVVGCG